MQAQKIHIANYPAFNGLEPSQTRTATVLMTKMASLGFYSVFRKLEVGPVITTYYFEPGHSSPLNKILNRAEDLALSVGVSSVLIKRYLNMLTVAIPNTERKIIGFHDCLFKLAQAQKTQPQILPILQGQSQTGEVVSFDLINAPHLLIAGSTNSGKSIFLSELICALAVIKRVSELKFVLVDTKQLDLTLFEGLEHVTEIVDKIENFYDILEILKSEVRDRTEMMKGVARNITEYNATHPDNQKPYIVLVIDELADILGQDKELAKSENETTRRIRIAKSIQSLAQISRAAGIHIIAATQRPSVNILSGDIKTNFPSRICFKLSSAADSRVVLDENGAEYLLGKGDYLYKTTLDSFVRRAHSAFVTMEDIKTILKQYDNIRRSFENC